MALENGSSMYMPVAPAYGNGGGFGGFGNDWGWIILLLLFANGGMWGGFGGGYGNMMLGYDFPWLLNGQNNINANTNNGFRDAMINDGINSVRDGINNLQTQLCGCCGDMQMALANGFSGVEQGANARQMADMQQMFALQSGVQSGFNATNTGIADLKYTVATENCADRTQAMQNTRDIIEAGNRNSQAIIDKLCQLELDGVKREADQLRAENSTLKNQGFIANEINQQNEIFYNRLKNCPVNTVPVFGNQPIFTCGANNSGCGCQSFYN